MNREGAGKAILFLGLGLGVVAIAAALPGTAHATETWLPKGGKKKVGKTLKDAARNLSAAVVASATKWAKARGIPVIDVLTTILLESRGDPNAHALSAKEDSRGAMQVNVRAYPELISKLGYKPDDLYKLDVGIEVGTAVLAAKRQAVMDILKSTSRPQEYDLGTLVRLYYAGPKYAKAWILNGTHFKNMETYVDHWKEARQAVADAMAANAYA